jgi:hypothetical protein
LLNLTDRKRVIMDKRSSGKIKVSKSLREKIRNADAPGPRLAAPWLVAMLIFLLFSLGLWWMADALGWVDKLLGTPKYEQRSVVFWQQPHDWGRSGNN